MGDFAGHPFRGNQYSGQTAYVNGAHATHTGRSKESYGTTFHEVQINEGSRAGERALISERQRAEQAGESKSGSTTPPPGARIITPQVLVMHGAGFQSGVGTEASKAIGQIRMDAFGKQLAENRAMFAAADARRAAAAGPTVSRGDYRSKTYGQGVVDKAARQMGRLAAGPRPAKVPGKR